MEKTMRWWSDCTANWREKWSKVRNERNKAREETKQLNAKLETASKDISSHKREKQELERQNDQLKKEIERIHILLLKHAGQFDGQIFEMLGDDPLKDFNFSLNLGSPIKENAIDTQNELTINSMQAECDSTATSGLEDVCTEEYILQGAVPKQSSGHKDLQNQTKDSNILNGLDMKTEKGSSEFDEEYVIQKLSMLQLRLEEATKTLQIERE